MKNKNSFDYTYSASQQEEIEKIRKKYAPQNESENKMEKLRRLDRNAEKPGTIAAITLEVISTLVFGAGLYFSLDGKENQFVFGIIIGVIGIVGMICALPLCNFITKKRREKIAPEILRLTEELSQK